MGKIAWFDCVVIVQVGIKVISQVCNLSNGTAFPESIHFCGGGLSEICPEIHTKTFSEAWCLDRRREVVVACVRPRISLSNSFNHHFWISASL